MPLNTNPAPSVTPSSRKVPTLSNYISLFDYSSHYDAETHEKIAKIFGNQSVSGMLYMLQAEGTMSSDKYIWTEEGRLHTVYNDVTRVGKVFTKNNHVFRVGETILFSANSTTRRGVVSAVDANTFTVEAYKSSGFTALGASGITAFVDGSEFGKGSDAMEGSLTTDLNILSNKPIVLRDKFEITGSDAAQISWTQTDEGGYLWFFQDQINTRRRWEDRMELAMLNGEVAETGSDAEAANKTGTEGFYEALRGRGNTFQGVASSIADFDEIIKRFDKQGNIQDYTFYVDRDQSLAIDDMLGALNAGHPTGLSYGVFNNDKDMAVNLGFTGFTRGTYNIFKTDHKLLNDPTTFGAIATDSKVRGTLIPVGTTQVYEGEYNGAGMGSKISTPFLQCMYRASSVDNRKYKTWLTGSVLGNTPTTGKDIGEEHHLSERMLNTVGANNFMLFEGA